MFSQLPALQRLINQLRQVPFLASKNIYRVAVYFLMSDREKVEHFCTTILDAKKLIKQCTRCFNWSQDESFCHICSSKSRNHKVICLVETWYDLLAIERTGGYKGVYHVLGGALSPLEGIGPEHLKIDSLLERLQKSDVIELIFATNRTPEGEATASFISSRIDKTKIKVSKLASGVPTGSNLEYMDRVTIYRALSDRRPF